MKLILNDKRKIMTAKSLVVLTRSPNKEFESKLIEASSKHSIKTFVLHPSEIDLPLESFLHAHKELPAPTETFLWNRVSGTTYDDYDQLISLSWQQLGAKLLNCPNIHLNYRDKYRQYLHLKFAGLPVIETHYCQSGKVDLIDFEGPYVVKTLRGIKGKGVIKVETREALQDFLTLSNAIGDNRFIIQKYVPYETEIRFLVHQGKILRSLKKSKKTSSWKHNLESSTWEEFTTPTQQMQETINKIDSLERKFFYAIDIISNNNNLQILEVNICPGIEGPDNLRDHSILQELMNFI